MSFILRRGPSMEANGVVGYKGWWRVVCERASVSQESEESCRSTSAGGCSLFLAVIRCALVTQQHIYPL